MFTHAQREGHGDTGRGRSRRQFPRTGLALGSGVRAAHVSRSVLRAPKPEVVVPEPLAGRPPHVVDVVRSAMATFVMSSINQWLVKNIQFGLGKTEPQMSLLVRRFELSVKNQVRGASQHIRRGHFLKFLGKSWFV